jgi:murein DD-endopeptidase MepM/ murein hydrolase activator NlpD
MKRTTRLAALALSLAAMFGSAAAADLAVNFEPSTGVWTYPIESARGIQGAMVQNIAIVNRGDTPAVVDNVRIEVLRDGVPIASVSLDPKTLDQHAKQGAALAQAGLLQALDFQFAPDRLLGPGTTLSDTRTLAPGKALLVTHQLLAFRGSAERLRVTVRAQGDDVISAIASGETTIRAGFAPGTFRFPLQGRWFVAASATAHSHHRWVAAEEFALDLVRIGEGGKTHRGDGRRMQDYLAYGEPVMAVADGEVVKVHDGEPDNLAMLRGPEETLAAYQKRIVEGQFAMLASGPNAIPGNHVVIRHADGVYSVYAHLKPGSVAVADGQRVVAGQSIGAIGGSGNSTEPHLHFHLCDGPDALHCAGMPAHFDNVEIPFNVGPGELQTGDLIDAR